MKIFVYETLKNHKTLGDVLHHIPPTRDAVLPGYREVDHKTWPTLIRQADASVKGKMFNVGPLDKHKLDAWEAHYARHAVDLADGTTAFAYILDPTTLGKND